MSAGAGGLPRSEVPAAFDAAAAGYDGLVGLNPGYHAHLRISARQLGIAAGGRGSRLLDAGCGTGASTAAPLAAGPQAQIVAVDASMTPTKRCAGSPACCVQAAGSPCTNTRWVTHGAPPRSGMLCARSTSASARTLVTCHSYPIDARSMQLGAALSGRRSW